MNRKRLKSAFRTALSLFFLALALAGCATVIGIGCGIIRVAADAVHRTVNGDNP
jgi:predicted small secreted protein